MVNRGYQTDDKRMLDYALWEVCNLLARGPAVDLNKPYFSAIGAAQTFGRFVEEPFPTTLGKSLQLQALNLGMSGAGPSFFLQRQDLLDVINAGKFAIVQMFSGRSVSNRYAATGANQGTLILRNAPNAKPQFAEIIYRQLLDQLSPPELVHLRTDNRIVYISEMKALLQAIIVPKILFYWSTRAPNYTESVTELNTYWGAFPHFVNQDVIDSLTPMADHTVEVIGSRGLPQALFDKTTGDPFEIWSPEKFPDIKHRTSNLYYPSPEMNAQAATALAPHCKQLLTNPPLASEQWGPLKRRRKVLLHFHIFKNAGSAIDRSLERCFGANWRTIDPTDIGVALDFSEIISKLPARADRMAVSSHQIRFPFDQFPDIACFPLIFLRHPLLRVQSIYDYERMDGRSQTSNAPHTKMANQLEFPDWIEWCLEHPLRSGPISNYQTRVCGNTNNGAVFDHWRHSVRLPNLYEALENLKSAHVGTVENFRTSLITIEGTLKPHFPELTLLNFVENANDGSMEPPGRRLETVEKRLGETIYRRLCEANEFDMVLYERFSGST